MARILVIDDDALVRDTIKLALEFEGHEASLVHSRYEGIREFRSGRFGLVICDIFTPDFGSRSINVEGFGAKGSLTTTYVGLIVIAIGL